MTGGARQPWPPPLTIGNMARDKTARWRFSLRTLMLLTGALALFIATCDYYYRLELNTQMARSVLIDELVRRHTHHGDWLPDSHSKWRIEFHQSSANSTRQFAATSEHYVVTKFRRLGWSGDFRYLAEIRMRRSCVVCHSRSLGTVSVTRIAAAR